MLPQWKDQQNKSIANNGTIHAMKRLEEASHCRQTCMVVNVWKSLLHLESSLIGLPLNNQFCLHCWKEIYFQFNHEIYAFRDTDFWHNTACEQNVGVLRYSSDEKESYSFWRGLPKCHYFQIQIGFISTVISFWMRLV